MISEKCFGKFSTQIVTRQKTSHLKLVPEPQPTITTISSISQGRCMTEVQEQVTASFSTMTPTIAVENIHCNHHHHNSATTVDLLAEDQREVFV